jgi:hypothetical protein
MIKRYENIYNPEGVFGLEVWWFFVKDTILFKHKPLGCVWVGGVVAFFLRYHPLKAHTTLSKSKKYMLFSKKCGSFLKKNNHTSHPNTLLHAFY